MSVKTRLSIMLRILLNNPISAEPPFIYLEAIITSASSLFDIDYTGIVSSSEFPVEFVP